MAGPAALTAATADGRVALLRGVNVGGAKIVPAAALKSAAAAIGLAEPRTVINSGNLIFRSDRGEADLEAAVAQAVTAATGVVCGVFVRTATDWRAMLADNPFPDAAERDGAQLIALIMRAPPDDAAVAPLRAAAAPGERLAVRGRVLWCDFAGGMGTSKMGSRSTRLDGTGRNWNTLQKIAALLG